MLVKHVDYWVSPLGIRIHKLGWGPRNQGSGQAPEMMLWAGLGNPVNQQSSPGSHKLTNHNHKQLVSM